MTALNLGGLMKMNNKISANINKKRLKFSCPPIAFMAAMVYN